MIKIGGHGGQLERERERERARKREIEESHHTLRFIFQNWLFHTPVSQREVRYYHIDNL